jgi:hypothetical protein
MTHTARKLVRFMVVAVVGVGCFVGAERVFRPTPASLVPEAQAIIGRPLTPLSYAGVARRTTRRAVATGTAVGAATAATVAPVAPVYVAPGCVQAVNAYGQVFYQCP